MEGAWLTPGSLAGYKGLIDTRYYMHVCVHKFGIIFFFINYICAQCYDNLIPVALDVIMPMCSVVFVCTINYIMLRIVPVHQVWYFILYFSQLHSI